MKVLYFIKDILMFMLQLAFDIVMSLLALALVVFVLVAVCYITKVTLKEMIHDTKDI